MLLSLSSYNSGGLPLNGTHLCRNKTMVAEARQFFHSKIQKKSNTNIPIKTTTKNDQGKGLSQQKALNCPR